MPPAAPDAMSMMETKQPGAGAAATTMGATPVAAICCMCACAVQPNPTNMCLQCLRTQVGQRHRYTNIYTRNHLPALINE